MNNVIFEGAFADCGPIKVLRESDSAAFVTIEDKRQMYIDQVQYVQRQVKETHDVDLIVKVSGVHLNDVSNQTHVSASLKLPFTTDKKNSVFVVELHRMETGTVEGVNTFAKTTQGGKSCDKSSAQGYGDKPKCTAPTAHGDDDVSSCQ